MKREEQPKWKEIEGGVNREKWNLLKREIISSIGEMRVS